MKRLYAVFLLCIFPVGVWAEASTPAKRENQKSPVTQDRSNYEMRGTEKFPLFVQALPARSTEIQVKAEEGDKAEHARNERWMMIATIALAVITALLALYTAKLYRATVQLGKDAKASGDATADKMERSIAEANRAAAAMEDLAKAAGVSSRAAAESVVALKDRTAQQMRAYLMVSIGNGLYQERHRDIRFDVRPNLFNAGQTPAHNMSYWARAAILPFPLPDDFEFTVHENAVKSAMLVGPRQGLELNAFVDDFVPDDEVESIKIGNTRRVYIWGIVTYTDIFNEVHTTKFCHSIVWIGAKDAEKILGTYTYFNNEAT